jgi:hypothetical protein
MRQNRTNLFLGILLILIGAWLVATRQVPALQNWLDDNFAGYVDDRAGYGVAHWLIRGLSMLSPARSCGIGGILYYQNANNDLRLLVLWALILALSGRDDLARTA